MDGEWESSLVAVKLYKGSRIWSPCWYLSTPLKTVKLIPSSTLACFKIKTILVQPLAFLLMQKAFEGWRQLFTGHFSCAETKRREKEQILSLQLQTSFYTSKQTHSWPLQSQTEEQHAPNQNCTTEASQWTGFKKGGCIRAPSSSPWNRKTCLLEAKKTSIRSWRSFSSCFSWTNALLLFTATAAGHLAAYSPNLNGRQRASSRLGSTLLATELLPTDRGFKQAVCLHHILSAATAPLHT